jgi:hypothetical protein
MRLGKALRLRCVPRSRPCIDHDLPRLLGNERLTSYARTPMRQVVETGDIRIRTPLLP